MSGNVPDVQRMLREDVSAVQLWMGENKITLNTLKTEFILIASKPKLKETEEHVPKMCKEKQCTKHCTQNHWDLMWIKILIEGCILTMFLTNHLWDFRTRYTLNDCKLSPHGSIKNYIQKSY